MKEILQRNKTFPLRLQRDLTAFIISSAMLPGGNQQVGAMSLSPQRSSGKEDQMILLTAA